MHFFCGAQKYGINSVWAVLANLNAYISKPVLDHSEFAFECEKLGSFIPMFFPTQNVTRKLHIVSYVLPKIIRSDTSKNICYEYMKFEQGGERLHAILNKISNTCKHMSKDKQLFYLIREVEVMYCAKNHEKVIECFRLWYQYLCGFQ